MSATSAINNPHPDDAPASDEADAFFDVDEATPDEPETPGMPDLTPEEQNRIAKEYTDRTGQDVPQVPESEAPGVTPEAQAAMDALKADVPEPLARQEQLAALAERERIEAGAKAAQEASGADPTPPAESDGPTEDPTSGSSEAPPSETADDGPRKGGPLSREYRVFQKVALTEKVLKHLLKQIDEGRAPEPRVAYFELGQTTARTVTQALGDTYSANRETLGEKCDMAGVSSRSFQERHVEPRQRVETALSIT